MARQRFIWPEIWKDPVFGRLDAEEQLLFIGLFSIADDDGRVNADPAYLRGELFTYKEHTVRRVKTIRDRLDAKCRNITLYQADGVEVIALLKWKQYQHPKYPRPSKFPPPPDPAEQEGSPNTGGALPEDSPNVPPGLEPRACADDARGVGLGWVGSKSQAEALPRPPAPDTEQTPDPLGWLGQAMETTLRRIDP